LALLARLGDTPAQHLMDVLDRHLIIRHLFPRVRADLHPACFQDLDQESLHLRWRAAWETLTRGPRDRSNPARQAQQRLDLATRTIGGREFEQWQYEVTGGGRIWYCPDPEKMIVLVTYAGVGHDAIALD